MNILFGRARLSRAGGLFRHIRLDGVSPYQSDLGDQRRNIYESSNGKA